MDESRTDLAELAFEAWQTETAEAAVSVQARRPVDAWQRAAFVYIYKTTLNHLEAIYRGTMTSMYCLLR